MASIETDEGTVNESVVTKRRVRSLIVDLEHGAGGTVTFKNERLKLVNGEVVRAFGLPDIVRDYETVKAETVTHGGQPVSLQTAFAVLAKFHAKWEAEDALV